jgi:hypothetical protein
MRENGIGKVVGDNFAKRGALLRHSSCATLAEPHTVPVNFVIRIRFAGVKAFPGKTPPCWQIIAKLRA